MLIIVVTLIKLPYLIMDMNKTLFFLVVHPLGSNVSVSSDNISFMKSQTEISHPRCFDIISI